MIMIASFGNPAEAEMACEFLKSNGITAAVADGTSMSVFGAGNHLTIQSLIVASTQGDEAKKLLSGYARQQQAGESQLSAAATMAVKRFDGYYETT